MAVTNDEYPSAEANEKHWLATENEMYQLEVATEICPLAVANDNDWLQQIKDTYNIYQAGDFKRSLMSTVATFLL